MSELTGLLASLREDSREEVEGVLARARREAEGIVDQADAECREARERRLAEVRRRMREEVARGMAEQGGAGRGEVLERRQEALDRILAAARRKLQARVPGPKLAVRLAGAAVGYLPPGKAHVRGGDRAVEAARRIAAERGDVELTVEMEPDLPGVVASTEDVEVEATLPALLDARRHELAVALVRHVEGSEGRSP